MAATRWKLIGRVERKKPKRLLGVYEFPDDAIWLVQDICTLEHMQAMLDRLQERSFVERGITDYQLRVAEARKVLRRLAYLITSLKQIAESNLARDYSGVKATRPHRQTIAEVWRLLLEGFECRK